MDLLLDTAPFLWWLSDDPKLGRSARAHIERRGNSVYVSAASAWEIAVKRASGKLVAPGDIRKCISDEGFLELPIDVGHAIASAELPRHHNDPFDRLLIAQAQLEDLTLVARDDTITRYDVPAIDAGS